MATEVVAGSKAMKEEKNKEDSPEAMDVDSVDVNSAAEWVFCNQFLDLTWPL